ncbi:MAG TPA: hypothetical protein VKB75_18035, partial [Jatrophihabitans sp.]|nr:hypothetical protein [Jatrophihabitans sp.]
DRTASDRRDPGRRAARSTEVTAMSFEYPDPTPSRGRKLGIRVGLIGLGVATGALAATALGATASTPSTTNGSGSTALAATAAPAPDNDRHGGPGGAAPVRSDEKAVSASTASTLKAAALKAVPGAKIIRVETDAGDAAYEVHMQKSDGSLVTVKFDKNLKQTGVEDGMGKGDPEGPGGHH